MSAPRVVSFGNSVPGAHAFAESVAHSPTLQALNKTVWLFSLVEITHLLFLVMLGGATLVLALRTLGVSLGDAGVAQVERVTRPWLAVGVIGGIVSGIFMSIATALTLVGNGAFFIKILALVAAILFSFALARRLRAGGSAAQAALAAAGSLLLAAAIWLFVATRPLVAGGILLLVVSAVFVALAYLAQFRGAAAERGDRLAQLLAIGTVVAWLTVTLGGRWIGFS